VATLLFVGTMKRRDAIKPHNAPRISHRRRNVEYLFKPAFILSRSDMCVVIPPREIICCDILEKTRRPVWSDLGVAVEGE